MTKKNLIADLSDEDIDARLKKLANEYADSKSAVPAAPTPAPTSKVDLPWKTEEEVQPPVEEPINLKSESDYVDEIKKLPEYRIDHMSEEKTYTKMFKMFDPEDKWYNVYVKNAKENIPNIIFHEYIPRELPEILYGADYIFYGELPFQAYRSPNMIAMSPVWVKKSFIILLANPPQYAQIVRLGDLQQDRIMLQHWKKQKEEDGEILKFKHFCNQMGHTLIIEKDWEAVKQQLMSIAL